ncbi:ATP-binding protein [Moorella naiadis]|uniref:ATP-binding protein n=1 Tax=Moorella naiadis (nom. illeg.) TaxID=3093670 RepID=UPI003D9CB6B1
MKEPQPALELAIPVRARDFLAGGDGAARIRLVLQQVGFPPGIIRRVAIAAYEAEMNIVIHSRGGELKAQVTPEVITIIARDEGPGIPDIDLAMQEGYSTAPREIQEMGFGAGMGLPNIRRCTDELAIESAPGTGTTIKMVIYNR